MQTNKENLEKKEKYPKLKLPSQNFKSNNQQAKSFLDDAIVKDLKEIFYQFSDSGKVDPHHIKTALRSVSKNY